MNSIKTDVEDFQQEALTHLQSLMAAARRLTREDSAAEDLVQDTYVKALRAKHQYQPGTHLRAWLLRIMRNTFINRYHRRTKERTLMGATIPDPVADGWMSTASMRSMRDPDSILLRPELERALRDAIDGLPDEFREVILLAEVEEFTYRETAEALGCPVGTVMSRLHRARKLLKRELAQSAMDAGIITEAGNGSAKQPIELNAFRGRSPRATATSSGGEN